MDGLIEMIIQGADFEALNVKPGDVLKGKLYVGPDGKTHTGEMEDRGAPELLLELNGRMTIPEGKYTGGHVKQIIPTMGETHVTPGSKQITLYTNGMYMTGNIVVDKLSNLVPENIKLGEYVGEVGPGAWQGYIVTDPRTFYYRGTFAPGQSMSDYIAFDANDYKANRTDELKYLLYTANGGITNGRNNVYSVFEAPIDLTSVNKLTVQYSVYVLYTSSSKLIFDMYLTSEKNIRYQAIDNLKIASSENEFSQRDVDEDIKTAEIDVSSLSREAYLSIYVGLGLTEYRLKIHSVKFE